MPEENQAQDTAPKNATEIIEDLSMAVCNLCHAATLMPGSKEQKTFLAKSMALAEPFTPQVEDNHDDEPKTES